uniref:Uncharacterized protein n=1 Tax=Hubei picorna-like virus 81 TaxID=1923166 RepID=A0A1L3KNN0_9VIRU|nr:hypothetical protein 1 [Hubei picorna-like virus 81]
MNVQQKLDIHPLPGATGPTMADLNPLTGWQFTGFKIKIAVPAQTNPLVPLFGIKCTPLFIPPIFYTLPNRIIQDWNTTLPIVAGTNTQSIVSVEITTSPCTISALAMMHYFSTWDNFKLRMTTSGNFVEKGSLYVQYRPYASSVSYNSWDTLPILEGQEQGGVTYGFSENKHAEGNFVQYDLSTNRTIELSAPYLFPAQKYAHQTRNDGSWLLFTPVTNLDVAGGSKVNLELALFIGFDNLSFNAPIPWMGQLAFPLSFFPGGVANYAYPIVLPDKGSKVDQDKGTFVPSSVPKKKEVVAEITHKFHGLDLG